MFALCLRFDSSPAGHAPELSKQFEFCIVSLQSRVPNQHLDSIGQRLQHTGKPNEIYVLSWSHPQNQFHLHRRVRPLGISSYQEISAGA